MQLRSHKTPISLIRDAVEAWRKQAGWSRETAAQYIVEAHEAIGGPAVSGIVFDPPTGDAFERAKVNADRVFRWFDDTTKDRNLLPLNMIWSVLFALPEDRRLLLVNELLAPVGMSASYDQEEASEASVSNVALHFCAIVTDSASATVAMSKMLDGIDPGEPEQAQKRLSIAASSIQRAIGLVNRILKRRLS